MLHILRDVYIIGYSVISSWKCFLDTICFHLYWTVNTENVYIKKYLVIDALSRCSSGRYNSILIKQNEHSIDKFIGTKYCPKYRACGKLSSPGSHSIVICSWLIRLVLILRILRLVHITNIEKEYAPGNSTECWACSRDENVWWMLKNFTFTGHIHGKIHANASSLWKWTRLALCLLFQITLIARVMIALYAESHVSG